MQVWWNSKEGRERLFQSEYANDFYTLAHLFERQIKPTYCGIASAVMVLNALRLRKTSLQLETKLDVHAPGNETIPFNCYTQLTFFNHDTKQGKTCKQVEGKGNIEEIGYTLDELAHTMRLLLLDVQTIKAQETGDKAIEKFRYDLMAYLNERGTFLIAQFDSQTVGRKGGGHFSPVVAYHKPSDSCLVMDTAGHKNPWFWVAVPLFYEAMHTLDQGEYRGYLVVSDKLDK